MRGGLVAVVAAAGALLLGFPGSAMADTAGEISGSVTNGVTTAAFAGVDVEVYSSNGDYVTSAVSDHNGNYTVSSLSPGSYEVEFSANGYLAQYYDGASAQDTASPVTVAAGQDTTGIDAALETSGAVSGRLTDAVSGGPIMGAEVIAYGQNGQEAGQTTTDDGGAYTIAGLLTGTYTIEFEPQGTEPYLSQYYASGSTGTPTSVSVTDGQTTTGISAALQSNSLISGTVTDASTGKPVPGAVVDVYGPNMDPVWGGVTDSNGRYAVGLPPGTYQISFEAGAGQNYITQYYDNAASTGSATVVTLANGGSVTANAALKPGGEISGSVIDAVSKQALSGIPVSVYATSGTYEGGAVTDGSGDYTIASLPSGSYNVLFEPSDGTHAPQAYNDASSVSAAQPVTVTTGSTSTGINAALSDGGTITGTVTDATSGDGASDVIVQVYGSNGFNLGWATTAANGSYTLGGLPAGSYYVDFQARDYAFQWYDGAELPSAPPPVAVTVGQTTSGIDATMSGGGSVSGTVDGGSSANPLGGVEVYLDGPEYASTTTASDGTYSVGGLAPGSYTAEFYDQEGAYQSQYYTTGSDGQGETSFTVSTGAMTGGISATLSADGSISGTVTDAGTEAGLTGISVSAYGTSVGGYGSATSGSGGSYTISDLPPGTYDLYFSGGDYLPVYYQGSVTVASGQTTSATSEALQQGGTVSGSVTDGTTGAGIVGATVTLYNDFSDYVASGTTAAGGAFSISGVPAGTYYVGFSDSDATGSYVTTYYGGATSIYDSTGITVSKGKTTTGINQALAEGGAVSGTVTDASLGSPLSGVQIDIDNSSGQVVASAATNSAGEYSITGLPAGSYTAAFVPSGDPSMYVEQYYDGQLASGSPTTFSVSADQTTAGIDAAMTRGGIVSGTVTAATGGADLSGITVTAYTANGDFSTTTSANGTYAIGGLPQGNVTVGFAPPSGGTTNYLGQYYDNEASQSQATSVYVTPGKTVAAIDAALQSAGQVTGVVTDAATQKPIQNVEVEVYVPENSYDGTYDAVYGTAVTNAKGIYTVSGLPTDGHYDVSFAVPDGDYLEQWYDGANAASTGTSVAVTQGSETTGVDAQLDAPAQIQGTVTDASTGKAIANAPVEIETTNGQQVASAVTTSTGAYDVTGLYPGGYEVMFESPTGSDYLPQYYDGATTASSATVVTVSAGGSATGINAGLQSGGQITGTVTSAATGDALDGVSVYIYNSSGDYVQTAETDAGGQYTASQLPTGDYVVEFEGASPYYTQYYDGQSSYQSANPVSVTAGDVTSSIDGALQSGGEITGTITSSATQQPISGAIATAETPEGGYIASATANSSGVYAITGLAAGDYTIVFSANGYGNETYSGTVSAAVDQTTSGIDGALSPDGSISGTVTDATTSANVGSVYVTAYSAQNGEYVSEATTASNGTYTIGNVAPGTYRVEFSPSDTQDYLGQWYDDESSQTTGTTVTVTSAETTSGINAALQEAGHITGTVTNSVTGAAIPYAEVYIDNASTGSEITAAEANANGNYSVGGLGTGSYLVSFYNSGYVGQYYDDQSTQSSANAVSVTTGQTSAHINAAMVPDGGVVGQVTDAATGDPLTDAYVEVLSSGGDYVAQAFTNSNGGYSISDLAPGSYILEVGDSYSSTGYVTQYYDGQYSQADANAVTVKPGATTTGLDVGLATYGAITGTVTDGSDNEAIPNVDVQVYDSSGDVVGSADTSATGQYTVGELAPGPYNVSFTGQTSAGQEVTEYYNQASSLANANAVTVASGQTTSSINATLISLPVNSAPPTIKGTAAQGETLTEVNGTWSPTPDSYGYQWERCDPSGNCSLISGATSQTYVPTALDLGDALFVEETATDVAGTAQPVESQPTASVVGEPPVNTLAPGMSGDAEQGQTLTEIPGSWTNQPTGYSYQWERCTGTGSCSDIPNATAQTYTPTADDVGDTLEVSETAQNQAGSATAAVSQPTTGVVGPGPVNTSPPGMSGSAVEGQTLTVQQGVWSGEPTSYDYQWERCDSSGAHCNPIQGALGSTYATTARDVGETIVVVETASNANGPGQGTPSAPSRVVTQATLTADAGESITATAGAPVTFDGSGSTPASVITGYSWSFGDGRTDGGVGVQHTYASAGQYTATLTVSDGTNSASSQVQVNVQAPAPGVAITVQDSGGKAIPGADVVFMASDGSRISATSGGTGTATLDGLPDGSDRIYAYDSGYQVAIGSVSVSGGVGSATITLTPGQVGTASLTSTPMTYQQIIAAGIDPNAPGNNEVIKFSIKLSFPDGYGEPPTLCGFINGAGQFVGDTGSCSGGGSGGGGTGGGGGDCTSYTCHEGNVMAIAETVDGDPIIQWLVLNGQASVLKQFFSVDMVINNLSPSTVNLDKGSATLNLPDGLSLAPTAKPQSLSQSVASIPGGGSADANWIVRGDTPGFYDLTADYTGTIDPIGAPITISAALQTPLHVWGADGLQLTVQADSNGFAAGQPYHVRLALKNTADVPFYNLKLSVDSTPPSQFIWQPQQAGFSSSVGELDPGDTLYSPTYIMVPDAASGGQLDPSQSFVSFAGSQLDASSEIDSVTAPTLYNLTAEGDVVGDVHLHWNAVPGASGYEVFEIPNLDTAFSADAISVATTSTGSPSTTELPAGTTDAYIPEPAGSSNYYAISTIGSGPSVLEHPVIQASPGVATPAPAASPPSSTQEACDPASAPSSTVQVFETTGDASHLLCDLPSQQLPSTSFAAAPASSGSRIAVNEKQTFQQMAGFGGTLTDSSAYLLMNDGEGSVNQAAVRELFGSYEQYGAALSYVRVPIGGNDFSQRTYTADPTKANNYTEDDAGPPKGAKTIDQMLRNFNIDHDREYLIPVLQAALHLNPALKLMATPWTAPKWMKCSNSTLSICRHGTLDGGTLRKGDEALYAAYLTKWLVAYHDLRPAINFDSITVQNEPNFATSEYPSTLMDAAQEETVIRDLHADLLAAHLGTKILGLDHNWNYSDYAKSLLHSSVAPDIGGTAFHCYQGKPSAQNGVEAVAPGKGIYETECAVGGTYADPSSPTLTTAAGSFSQDLVNNTKTEIIDGVQDWSKTVMFWELAADDHYGPTINDNPKNGCTVGGCVPVIGMGQGGDASPQVGFWVLSQVSDFVSPGAYRISSTLHDGNLWSVAFRNPHNGSIALVVLNTGGGGTARFTIEWHKQTLAAAIPGGAVQTYVWLP